ncbi:MAG: hypothetical protein K9I95_04630 [Flavobacteriaceae bacterium]|nr:hypothetical protein [Flavobacteriaceae bacterium]
MSKFVPKIIEEVSINISVYKLLVNGKCQFDEFYKEHNNKIDYKNQLGQIQNILLSIGKDDLEKLPVSKFKQLKRNKRDPNVDYEIRTRDFRVYLVRDKRLGKIIVLGGLKKNQTKDLLKLRSIKKEYFNL